MSELSQDLAELRIERKPEGGGASRWVFWGALVVIIGTAGFGGWRWVTREKPIEVQATAVTERAAGTAAAVLNASGYVTARRRATISSKMTGKVVEVNVEEGMAVKEGQILARLDDSTPRAALAVAKEQAESARRAVAENDVRLKDARVTLQRREALLKEGFGTQQDVDQGKADVDALIARIAALNQAVKVAESQIDLQQTEINDTIIRAPFSGIATTKNAQPGEMVSPVSAGGGFTRTGICTIVDMHSLEVEVDVNESYINRVKPNQGVISILDAYPDWQIPSHVIAIIPTADRQKATVTVRIGFNQLDPRILPDMGIKVTFLSDEKTPAATTAQQPTVLVPKAAVKTASGQSYVFVVKGDVVERRAVRTGREDGDRLEVLGGLSSGDRVVITPPAELKDGSKVTVK